MSRIQQILEKAERDGVLHRTAPLERPRSGGTATPIDWVGTFRADERPTPDEQSSPAAQRSAPGPANRILATSDLDHNLIAPARADGIAAEQYRALRTRILRLSDERPIHTVLVTSPCRRDGRSVTVANLGLAMAQDLQRRICVLDADFRAPDQHRLFGLPESPGLSDVLIGRASLEEALVTIESYHIAVLPAGRPPSHPAELLGTTEMCRVLATLHSRFDAVIIDAPSATPLADIGVLMPLVDSVLVIVRAGVTLKPAIRDAVGSVDAAKFIGFVLNDAA
jgi:capsular exopolysaccharide synthesis family protein